MAKIGEYLFNSNPFPWDPSGDNCLLLKINGEYITSHIVGSRKTLNKRYNDLIMNLLNIGEYKSVQEYLLVEIMNEKLWKNLTMNLKIEKSIFDVKVKNNAIKIIRWQLLDTIK